MNSVHAGGSEAEGVNISLVNFDLSQVRGSTPALSDRLRIAVHSDNVAAGAYRRCEGGQIGAGSAAQVHNDITRTHSHLSDGEPFIRLS
jgi:hypothetical protein